MSKQPDESRAIPLSSTDAIATAHPSPPARYTKAHEQLMRSHVHYMGFRITDEGREYTLRATNEAPRLFVFLITHQQFQLGRARYQDAPDLCCSKLARALMDDGLAADHESPMVLTAAELADYRVGRLDPSARRRKERRNDAASTV
jgi:hypothetical protein